MNSKLELKFKLIEDIISLRNMKIWSERTIIFEDETMQFFWYDICLKIQYNKDEFYTCIINTSSYDQTYLIDKTVYGLIEKILKEIFLSNLPF